MTMMMLGAKYATHSDSSLGPQETCETSDRCVSHCAAYGKVCPCYARAAGNAVCKQIRKVLFESQLFEDGEPSFRKVNRSDISIGNKLGEGGFSFVNACTWKEEPQSLPLAIKYLKRRVMVERKTFEYGAADLANEAFFLARLNHPNIIQLHAVTEGSVEKNISAGEDGGFFIILNRLDETLEERMVRWRSEADEVPSSLFYRLSRDYKEKQRALLRGRVQVALEISKVMEYLHGLNIVFRDLKPDNVGFDSSGTLKLFDFGLAKEVKARDAVEEGKYKMTGHTGSRRYMAPEGNSTNCMSSYFHCEFLLT